jgi:hypothetical protein
MAIPRPTPDEHSVEDEDGALLESWRQGLRWRALPSAVGNAIRFTARAAPDTVALAIGNGLVGALTVAALYLVLQRLLPQLADVDSLADAVDGPARVLLLTGLLLLLVQTLSAGADEYLQGCSSRGCSPTRISPRCVRRCASVCNGTRTRSSSRCCSAARTPSAKCRPRSPGLCRSSRA